MSEPVSAATDERAHASARPTTRRSGFASHDRFLWREGHLGLLPSHGGIAPADTHLVGLGRTRDLVLGGLEADAACAYEIGPLIGTDEHRDRLRRARQRRDERSGGAEQT